MDLKEQIIGEYLTRGCGFRKLAAKYGISRITICKCVMIHQGIHNLPPPQDIRSIKLNLYAYMQDFISYAKSHHIELFRNGSCQFCGARVKGGVFECHENVHHLSEILDFNNPKHYETRFLSVDALALQHCELHGLWNNHIHLTRLFLIFENGVAWDYSKTPQLSIVINNYKRNSFESLTPPPYKKRGRTTTSDRLNTISEEDAIVKVKEWATDVFYAFKDHHNLISSIAKKYMERYHV